MHHLQPNYNHVILKQIFHTAFSRGITRKNSSKIVQLTTDIKGKVGNMDKLDATKARVVELARLERGRRSRDTVIAGTSLHRSVYQDFEAGKSWPHAATLEKIESVLGWPGGIIEAVCKAGIAPERISLGHLRGELPLTPDVDGLARYTTDEILQELAVRAALDAQGGRAARELFSRLEGESEAS